MAYNYERILKQKIRLMQTQRFWTCSVGLSSPVGSIVRCCGVDAEPATLHHRGMLTRVWDDHHQVAESPRVRSNKCHVLIVEFSGEMWPKQHTDPTKIGGTWCLSDLYRDYKVMITRGKPLKSLIRWLLWIITSLWEKPNRGQPAS